MSYLIELRTPTCSAAYVLAQADSRDDARALVDAQLGRAGDLDDVDIVAIHTIH
jgi:hypothetical protein